MPEDLLEALLEPDDDMAWKRAVGHALHDVRRQVTYTNGRVTALEAWRQRVTGALIVMAAGMPVITFLISLAVAK